MDTNKIVIGFDISSKTIGWCALKIDTLHKSIIHLESGFIKPPKTEFILSDLVDTRSKILDIINKYKPNYIGVEDLIKFMPKSTATTVVVLTSFNRMVCMTAYDYLKDFPALFNVMTIRHGLKLSKKLPKKEEMPELVSKHLGITFPYVYISKGKNKGKIKEESYDIADGTAVALFYAIKILGLNKKK